MPQTVSHSLPQSQVRSRSFPGLLRSTATARAWLRGVLASFGLAEQVVDDAELCLGEMAANAARHAIDDRWFPCYTVLVRLRPGVVRLEVTDPIPGDVRFPAADEPVVDLNALDDLGFNGLEDPGGRGLLFVVHHSIKQGCEPAAVGKTVWCELIIPGST